MSNVITYSPTVYWEILHSTHVSSEGVEELLELQFVLQNMNTDRISTTIKKDIRMLAAIINADNIYGLLDFINNKGMYTEKQDLITDILYSTDIEPSVEQLKFFIQDIASGYSCKEAADRRNIPLRMAYKYDKRFGFTVRCRDKFIDKAIQAIEDKVTIKKFAERNNITYSKSQSTMVQAKKIIKELL